MSIHDCSASMAVVAVDVGKNTVALSVTDEQRHRLFGPVDFAMTRSGLEATVTRLRGVVPAGAVVKVGIEAAGHYHQPLMAPESWPSGWELVELNPAHVTEQRRVQGRRRVKTDAIDLEAITELVLAGQGKPVTAREEVLGELTAWAAHRTRRVGTRTATKNQLLGQLDRAFPGLTLALPDVLGTKVGRLVAPSSPTRPACSLGRHPVHPVRRVPRAAGPTTGRRTAGRGRPGSVAHSGRRVARRVLAADLRMLAELDQQIEQAEDELAELLPASPFRTSDHRAGLGHRPRQPPTVPRSVTRTGGPDRASSTERPGCRRCSTSPPDAVGTGRSAGKAASNSAAR